MLRPLPRACSVSLLQVPLGFSGLLLLRLLAGVVGALHPVSGCSSCGVVCLVCRWGSPAAFFFPLEWVCFWLGCLQSLWAAKEVSAALRGSPSFSCVCWSFTFFWSFGWFLVTGWWPLLRLLVLDSSDARLHLPDALASASTPISGRWMVQAPAFSWALPWVLPSRFPCWLLACGN